MKLTLYRKYKNDTYTIGILYVDGVYFCETVEDRDRGLNADMSTSEILKKKVHGMTAIPAGIYKIVLSVSPKFKTRVWGKKYGGLVPELLNVKGYSGVRIHPANYDKDVEGCIGPGENKIKGGVINSTIKYYGLMDKYILPAWTRKEEMIIEII